jgi:nitrogen fixation protein FixH
MKWVLAVVSLLGLATVVATVWIGTVVMEPKVVDDPYERGLRYDQERAARAQLGWQARFDRAGLRPAAPPLAFALVDQAGAPVEGAAIEVVVRRASGGGDDRRGEARALGGGRYAVDLAFPEPGFWDVRLDARRGRDQVGLVQQVRVEGTAAPACDLAAGPCPARAGPLEVTLDLGRSLRLMQDLPVAVAVRRAGAPVDGASVEVAFAMRDMNMGENRVALSPAGAGQYRGAGVLVRCASGRRDWVATVTVRAPGAAPESARFEFAARE